MTATEVAHFQVIGAILAGGRSHRMGRRKADIPLGDGRPIIAHVIAQMKSVCPDMVIVGGPPVSIEGVRHLPDTVSGLGPLGGLHTLLGSGLADAYLVAACDQPFLEPSIFHLLLAGDPAVAHLFLPIRHRPIDPFPGYYPATLLSEALKNTENTEAWPQRARSMQRFIQMIPVTWVPLPASLRPCIKSLNTPEDFAEHIPPICPDGLPTASALARPAIPK